MTRSGTEDAGAASALIVSGMYPSADNPAFGAFVAKQDAALTRLGVPHRMVVNTRWRPGWLRGAVKYASLLVRTFTAASSRDFDVVVGHFLYPSAWLARLAARIGGTPYVVVAHGTDVSSIQRRGPLARACARATRGAACVVAVSRDLEERLRGELDLPDSVATEVVNMGVDRSVFRPRAGARAELGWGERERVVLFAGNLIPRKDPVALVEAFAVLKARGKAHRLVMVGDGELRLRLVGRAAELGLGDEVKLTGALPPARLAVAMSAADVFVLPSRAEPLGVVLLEAMACGTPCVATQVGGIPEILGEAQGRLVEPGDAVGLAAAIEHVLGAGKPAYTDACLRAAGENDLETNTKRFADILGRVVEEKVAIEDA
jgi:glycosyltransferase involved in cell wall biosynthesis